MIRTKIAAIGMAALALAAGPLTAAPATAEETHVCDQLFAEPWEFVCKVPLGVVCAVYPRPAICR